MLAIGDRSSSNSLTPIDTATNTAGTAIAAGNVPFGVAASADGTTAYVADYSSNNDANDGVTTIDLGAGTSSFLGTNPMSGTFKPLGLALAPDGRALWLVYPPKGMVQKVDLSGSAPVAGTPFSDGTSDGADAIALSPDGHTAWVDNQPEGTVTPIDLTTASPTPGSAITVGSSPYTTCDGASGTSSWPFGIGVSPDGSKVFVADIGSSQLSVINTGTHAVTNVALPAGGAYGLAVAPDGGTVYVTQPCAHDVVPVSVTGTPAAGTPITVTFPDDASGSPQGIAITPDGRHLYVGDGTDASGDEVVDVPLPSGSPQTAITAGTNERSEAITPDQAPVASFTAGSGAAGSPIMFDASSSTVAVGHVARYDWSFGDGSTASSTVPTTSHTYATSGTYSASVTETDDAGTSTTVVYTGQQVIRDGGPSAHATKSVVVSAAPQPAVSQSTFALGFGLTGVGQTNGPRAVTLRNTGTVPLVVSRASLGGADPGDFRIVSDGCGGQSIAAGASCTTTVAFVPRAAGARSATLAFTDNASGSPHVVELGGNATTRATITGTVRDDGGAAVSGARLTICTYSVATVCATPTTDAHGTYTASVPPDTYQVEVFPPAGANLFAGAEVVTAPAGPSTADFTLHPPAPIPSGITFDGQTSGVPRSFWQSPDTLQTVVSVPSGGEPGTIGASVVEFWASAGESSPEYAFGHLAVLYLYDANGIPRYAGTEVQDPAAPAGSRPLGSWSTSLTSNPANGADARGLTAQGVFAPPPNGPFFHGALGYEIDQFRVFLSGVAAAHDLARAAGGPDLSAFSKALDDYDGFQPRPSQPKPGSPKPSSDPVKNPCPTGNGKPFVQGKDRFGDRTFRFRDGTTWYPDGPLLRRRDGSVVHFAHPFGPVEWITYSPSWVPSLDNPHLWDQSTGLSPNVPGTPPHDSYGDFPTLDLRVAPDGSSIRDDSPGVNQDRFDFNNDGSVTDRQTGITYGSNGLPRAGDLPVARAAACSPPPPPPPPPADFTDYKDPSGTVTTTSHIPVAGATVVLVRAARSRGPFAAVPNRSAIMSPSNRRNPDHTTVLGIFHWDVIPGFYRVTASRSGCTAAHGRGRTGATRVLAVPPPAIGLSITLRCPHLRRGATHTKLVARALPLRQLLLSATVRGRHPAGVVTFLAGHRRLAVVPLDPRRSRAVVTVAGRSGHGFRASYGGDGVNAPSHS